MGIPAAFRWLSNKYPKIISPVMEEQPVTMEGGGTIPVDITQRNPNGEEFDNLYLDMNGIVHPCSHPEDKAAPEDEEEMMLETFKYTDRVVNMVRPRKLLMIAVDGVAPRAKMNQQRSRRFRAAQEAKQKESDKQELLKLLKQKKGGRLPSESVEAVVKKAFDTNSITPGTPFMDILAASLRYWCQYKLNTDPGWAKLKVIISDAMVPGEGEHKIMSFIRSQRSSPEHDPNTRHVIYGLDADFIMLGLATHEPHFRVLREDVFFRQVKSRTCKLCGQQGHEAQQCRGDPKPDPDDNAEKEATTILKPFIWLHVAILREYLAAELAVAHLPFRFDLDRAVDDWIFMCCFVGNDFLPHLPALEIREHGIDMLTSIWRENLPSMGGYVTKDGHIDWSRAQCILNGLGKQEDSIFRRRKEQEDRREANAKRRKLQTNGNASHPGAGPEPKRNGHADPTCGLQLHPIASYPARPPVGAAPGMPNPPGLGVPPAMASAPGVNVPPGMTSTSSLHAASGTSIAPGMAPGSGIPTAPGMGSKRKADRAADAANKSAAEVLKKRLRGEDGAPAVDGAEKASSTKRKVSELQDTDGSPQKAAENGSLSVGSGDGPIDTVRLWEEGYADRYYQQKFGREPNDEAFRRKVAHAYAEGLAWVLLYYFQGCPSWDWYYPYHYAPFAADFQELDKLEIAFEKGYVSKPLEQLMSVLPAASRHALPEVFHDLMTKEDSEIIDFYPEDFEIDLNGKKMAWQGVALLPFIDMPRLLAAVENKYPLLSDEDRVRNAVGRDVLLFSESHEKLYDEILTKFYSKRQGPARLKLDPKASDGLSGRVEKQVGYVPHGSLRYPLERRAMPDLDYDRSVSVYYDFPKSIKSHKSMLLRGAQLPTPALTRSDIEIIQGKASRGGYQNHQHGNHHHQGGGRGGRFDDQNRYRSSGFHGRDHGPPVYR